MSKRKAGEMEGGIVVDDKEEKYSHLREEGVPLTVSRVLDQLESQAGCNCFIKVKEGYIPAHTLNLNKSNVLNGAFKSTMKEGKEMEFDLSDWDTQIVLDVIEFMYTESFENAFSFNVEHIFQLFYIVHYLDIAGLSVQMLIDIAECAYHTIHRKEGSTFKTPRGLTQFCMWRKMRFDGSSSMDALHRAVWIVTNYPEMKLAEDEVISYYCRAFFTEEIDSSIGTIESSTYSTQFSFETIKSIIAKCELNCKDYSWETILSFACYWFKQDPSARVIQFSSLVESMCFKNLVVDVDMFQWRMMIS